MKKDFYIVVPFDNEENKTVKDSSIAGLFSWFFKSINAWVSLSKIQEQLKNFTAKRKKLISRANTIKTALDAIWIKSKILDKKELIKLLVDNYNPELDIAKSDFDGDVSKYDIIDN
jgi:response regulator of citrate/malate metabolism